jgi:hypothetical protein
MKYGNARPEKLREHAEDRSEFNNINRKCQVQNLVVTIPACKPSTQIADRRQCMFTHKEEPRRRHGSRWHKLLVVLSQRWGL